MILSCFECGTVLEAENEGDLGEVFLVHVRAEHDLPFPDQAIRNYAEATQRLTGASARLDALGDLAVHRVTEERVDDWLAFFDRDAFVGTPEWAACYCLEPHVRLPAPPSAGEPAPSWRQNREAMAARLRSGKGFGYLAYVDGKAAGWVNASKRSDYALYRLGADGLPPDADTVGVACFIIAPPYRRHGVAAALLDRVLADAPTRGVGWVEAYPFNEHGPTDARNFRGQRSMFDARGFEAVEVREHDTIVRKRIALG